MAIKKDKTPNAKPKNDAMAEAMDKAKRVEKKKSPSMVKKMKKKC